MQKRIKWFVTLTFMMMFLFGGVMCVHADDTVYPTMITARYSGSVNIGAAIDKSRFTVVAYYTDGTNRTLDADEFTITPSVISTTGNNAVNVSYTCNGTTVTINATVVGRSQSTLTKITAVYNGGKVTAGDMISRGDVKVTAYYGDGTSAEVDTWHFANYIITGGTNIVYIVYTEDGYTRNCSIKVQGQSLSEKILMKITAEYTGDDLTAGSKIDGRDVQVSAYFKYISTLNTVTTSMEGVDDWWFGNYTITEGTNTVTVYYEYGGVRASATIEVEGLDYGGNWVYSDGFYRFLTNDGEYLQDEWYQENGEWYHFNESCNMDIGWRDIDNNKYYFDDQGHMAVGWKNIRNHWYYFRTDGRMAVGWVKDGLYWYYMNEEGRMHTGWIKDAGRWYYMSLTGIMATGWFPENGAWYFLTKTGAMATGWYQVNDKWYYADINGVMSHNTWIDNYYVDESGAWTMTR